MKSIILNFDGTCNDPEDAGDFFEDSSISNILKYSNETSISTISIV